MPIIRRYEQTPQQTLQQTLQQTPQQTLQQTPQQTLQHMCRVQSGRMFFHSCINIYIHTYIHLFTHAYMPACMHACIHTYVNWGMTTTYRVVSASSSCPASFSMRSAACVCSVCIKICAYNCSYMCTSMVIGKFCISFLCI
jgi:hypothetical protein